MLRWPRWLHLVTLTIIGLSIWGGYYTTDTARTLKLTSECKVDVGDMTIEATMVHWVKRSKVTRPAWSKSEIIIGEITEDVFMAASGDPYLILGLIDGEIAWKVRNRMGEPIKHILRPSQELVLIQGTSVVRIPRNQFCTSIR